MYDAIVIGVRCAGSPTAMLLARKGWRVLLVDKATFPSDTISSHYIHHRGIARLKQWGLLDQVVASNCPPVTTFTVDLQVIPTYTVDFAAGTVRMGDATVARIPRPPDGVTAAYCPRRTILDKILIDAAARAGAEVREGFTVSDLIWEDDRLVAIRGHAKGGGVVERARMIIGADGIYSMVARKVNAPVYEMRPSYTCAYHTYWSGVPVEGMEVYLRDGQAIHAVPTNDGLALIGVGVRRQEFRRFRGNIEANYLRTLELAPALAERVRAGTRVDRYTGMSAMPNFFRRPFGPGWALVGDAGYHKDPITGQGITDAFRDAELLAEAIDAGLSGRRPLEEALADYERLRNEAALPTYEVTCRLAALEPPTPRTPQLLAALAA